MVQIEYPYTLVLVIEIVDKTENLSSNEAVIRVYIDYDFPVLAIVFESLHFAG